MLSAYREYMPTVHPGAWVAPSADVIGDVVLEADANVWFNATLRGDVSRIRIGARTNVQDNTVIHVSSAGEGEGFDALIGSDVTIGHACIIHACTIHDRALIGMGSLLLDGAVVEAEAMVGAGALIPPGKRVPAGELWLGRPAQKARMLSADERAGFRDQAAHYVALARRYAARD
jgi:carbonic anhydrase/acetyltransferase-like protein (isoleucine patch superfamily)